MRVEDMMEALVDDGCPTMVRADGNGGGPWARRGQLAGGLPSDRYWRPERVGVANALG